MNSPTTRISHRPTALALLVFPLSAGVAVNAESAPKRLATNWNQCTPSGDQTKKLEAGNPDAMEACKQMAQQAQAQGHSFAFMCYPTGKIACCNDSTCVPLGSMAKRNVPGLRPERIPQGMSTAATSDSGR